MQQSATLMLQRENRVSEGTERNNNDCQQFFSKTRRAVMNRGYFDVILVSLFVASCYMFIAPM
jgi:hypothetical protein